MACSASFLVMNLVTEMCLKDALPRRVLCAIAILMNGITCCLRASSRQYGMPHTVPFFLFAMCLNSAAAGMDIPLEASEGIDTFKLDNNHVDGLDLQVDNAIVDLFSNMRNFVTNIIFLIAIQVGATLYSSVGYEQTNMIYGAALTFYALINWLFNVGCSPFEEVKQEKLKMKELQSLGSSPSI